MKDQLFRQIKGNFPFILTKDQEAAVDLLAAFCLEQQPKPAFVLKGYAGTGKTTVMGALVRSLLSIHMRVVLMAPTGRAAKVLSASAGYPAFTIHKKIYRQKSILDTESFQLDRNMHENTLFLVDEASMISNDGLSGHSFGSGRLLDDLITYVCSGRNCRLLLLGDQAQLPPVGQEDSPALSISTLRGYGMTVTQYCLREVMRQNADSGILSNATMIREILGRTDLITAPFRFRLKGFTDICNISGADLIETLNSCYSRDGIDETMVLTRSNKRAMVYNNGIRRTILDREDELCRTDRLMIVKNNYYWTEKLMAGADAEQLGTLPSFIANGDIAQIRRVRHQRELYGFRFEDAVLSFPDYGDLEIDVTLLMDSLHSESPALTHDEQDRLFHSVLEDYAHITNSKDRMKALRQDPHFNALQVKYAYAVTCHKAQGGQWMNIFIDQGYIPDDERGRDYYRWLYTALTRATSRVYLVNWPPEALEP